jgi:thiamine-phosphate pyrophosphorylase
MGDWAAGRILDANFNRAREGLRVIEEFARFLWDDPVLSGQAKRLRHGLLEAVGRERVAANVLCRDTAGDVGTAVSTAAQGSRADAAEVLSAAFKRCSEALRVLEEYGKCAPGPAVAVERLRYDLYVLESAFARRLHPAEALRRMRLMVIVTGSLCRRPLEETVEAVLAGGADCVQLREKNAPDGRLLDLAGWATDRCHAAGRLLIMNDRPDIAALAGADGVHVGREDLPIGAARRIVGPQRIVGASCQSIAHARAAVLAGADYVGVGPLFASATKPRDHVPGLELMRGVAAEIRIPALGIAGIGRATLKAAMDAGARGVAVCSAILAAEDPEAETRWFLEQLAAAAAGEAKVK